MQAENHICWVFICQVLCLWTSCWNFLAQLSCLVTPSIHGITKLKLHTSYIIMILQMLMSVLVRSFLVTPMPTVLTMMVVSHVLAREDTLEMGYTVKVFAQHFMRMRSTVHV